MKISDFIADCITALICLCGLGGGVYLISLGSVLTITSGIVVFCIAVAFTWGAFVNFNKYN